jgi:SAM-dependent methyltransferase
MSGPKLFSRLYDPVMELPERAGLGELRRGVLRGLRGRVLELGIGTGRNLPLYGAGVDSLTGIDPDEAMLVQAEKRAGDVSFPVELVAAPAEELPFGDGSFDAVVSTLVFCTVQDPSRALGEVRRVLKRGGEFRLLEHVRVEKEPFGWMQEKATPLWKHVAGGCHLDRDTLEAVCGAGFEVERAERHLGGLGLSIFAKNLAPGRRPRKRR